MCSLWWLLTMMLPNASTVPGWQPLQLVSVIVGRWGGSIGGMPWQLPQLTCPVDVHRGDTPPWQYELEQVWVS